MAFTQLIPEYAQLSLGIGRVAEIDPASGLYWVQPIISPLNDSASFWATCLGTSQSYSFYVQDVTCYQVGSYVLYVESTYSLLNTILKTPVIIGGWSYFPVALDQTPIEEIGNSGINIQTNPVIDVFSAISNRKSLHADNVTMQPLFDASSLPGDRIFQTKNGVVRFSNNTLLFKSGLSSIELNSIYHSIQYKALFEDKRLIDSINTTALIGRKCLHTSKRAGNASLLYDDIYEVNETGDITLRNGAVEHYKVIDQSGDAVGGEHSTVVTSDNRNVLSRDSKYYNGSMTRMSSTGMSFIKTPAIRGFEYTGNKLEPDDNTIGDIETLPASLFTPYDSDIIDLDSPYALLDTDNPLYDIPEPTSIVQEGKDLKIYPNSSAIQQLDDGTLLFKDGWGSEIRMYQGNIQICAANNVLYYAGRDLIALCGGAIAMSADDAIHMESSTSEVKIKAEKQLQLMGGNDKKSNVVIESSGAAGLQIIADSTVSLQSKDIALINRSSEDVEPVTQGTISFMTAGTVVMNATNIQGVAQQSISILNTSGASLTLNGQAAVITASEIRGTGSLTLDSNGAGNISVSGVSGDTVNVALAKNDTPHLYVAGSISLTDDLTCLGNATIMNSCVAMELSQAVRSEYVSVIDARSFKAHKAAASKRAEKLRSSAIYSNTVMKSAVSKIKTLLTSTLLNKLKFRYTRKSRAIVFREPDWCVAVQGVTRDIAPVNGTYIYPGKDFWTGTGILTATDTTFGAGALTFNRKNAQDE